MVEFRSITSSPSFTSAESNLPNPERKNKNSNAVTIPEFIGQNAYLFVEKQVEFGSRVPNTEAHELCRLFIEAELKKYAHEVVAQSFLQEYNGSTWELTNIIASFYPECKERILLGAHWDSRPYSDWESNPLLAKLPVPGANDGASGVALLLELARILASQVPAIGVDIIFFDGEDMGTWHDEQSYCFGSRYFAQHFPLPYKPRYAVLLDMVGDKEALFSVEQYSYEAAPHLVHLLWGLGRRIAPSYFLPAIDIPLLDDHVPLIEAGIPAIVIVDSELIEHRSTNPRRRYWHTQSDSMENISAHTIEAVGRVLTQFLYEYHLLL